MAYDRNKYLIENYGITAVEYAERAMLQGGACKCCGQIPTGRDLHVDHDHRVAKTKIKSVEFVPGLWRAFTLSFNQTFEGPDKLAVVEMMRMWLLKKSVRGLLCWKCNEGLRSFKNNAEVLRTAANYMDEFAATLVT
jgi:hypothetical protein